MVMKQTCRNKGANAGRDRSINLGSYDPVRVTPGNLPVNLMNLRNVLVHNNRWKMVKCS